MQLDHLYSEAGFGDQLEVAYPRAQFMEYARGFVRNCRNLPAYKEKATIKMAAAVGTGSGSSVAEKPHQDEPAQGMCYRCNTALNTCLVDACACVTVCMYVCVYVCMK